MSGLTKPPHLTHSGFLSAKMAALTASMSARCRHLKNSNSKGSHHRLVVILVPDDKLDCFGLCEKISWDKNGVAFYPGPVGPPRADDSPLRGCKKSSDGLIFNGF